MFNYKESLPNPTPCSECGGERVRTVLHVDNNNYSKLLISRYQQGLIDFPSSGVAAFTCVECGNIRFYATEPHNLADRRPDAPFEGR